MLGLALLLTACALLVLAAGATTALIRPEGRLDAAITFGVVAAAGAAAVMLAAGAAGALNRVTVLALEAAWAATAAALVVRAQLPRPTLPRWPRRILRRHPWEAAVVSLGGLAVAWQLLVALVLPPFAYDALTYHLTIVATWLQEGSLAPSPLSLCCARYPGTAELMFAWPALFLGSDTLIDTVQLPFAVLGALAVAGVARSAGLYPASAAAAGGLFAMTPIVLVQAPTNYADVILAACVLAALHALVRFSVSRDPRRLVVAGLAAGVVLGIKGTGILWAAALVACAAVLVAARRGRGEARRRRPARALAGFLAACLALGSYWYVRNWVDTGNPLYPFRVAVAGATVFEGPFEVDDVLTRPDPGAERPRPVEILSSWAADARFWRRGSYDYQERRGGFGPLWPWLALPLLVPLTVVLTRRRSPALVALAAVALVVAVQPYAWWSRFTIPLAAMGAVAVAAAVAWVPRAAVRRGVAAAALVLAVAGIALSSAEVDPAARARALPAPELLELITAPPAERTIGRLFFPEYRFLERVPDEATIVVDLRARPVRFVYPLFGPRHERTVLRAAGVSPPPGAWVVTGRGRPLDRALAGDRRFRLAFAVAGLHAWAPATSR